MRKVGDQRVDRLLIAALEERLGLRLLEQVDALDVAVVDNAEPPRLD